MEAPEASMRRSSVSRYSFSLSCRVPFVCAYPLARVHRKKKKRVAFFILMIYILSGTSIPNNSMPFLMVLATFFAMMRRVIFSVSVSALRML